MLPYRNERAVIRISLPDPGSTGIPMTFIQRFTLAGLGAILACAANAGTPGTRIVEDIGNRAGGNFGYTLLAVGPESLDELYVTARSEVFKPCDRKDGKTLDTDYSYFPAENAADYNVVNIHLNCTLPEATHSYR